MESIKDTPAWRGKNRYGRHFKELDLVKQIKVILDTLGRANMRRDKSNGSATADARESITYQFFEDVRAKGYQIHSVLNLDQRHIRCALESWVADARAPSTIQTRMSVLRWLAKAIGKDGLVHDASSYGIDPEALARDNVPAVDKSWTPHAVDPQSMVASAKKIDIWVGTQLDLMRVFGLRQREAIMIRPAIADQGASLRVEEGTKGGRTRIVPIETDEQRAVLDSAKLLALRNPQGRLCKPGKKIKQAKRRFTYVVGERLGATKAARGVTPHGLRHEYANDVYERVGGVPSAVRGGPSIVDRAADERARHQVSQNLGHARLSITASYTGRRMRGRPRNAPSEHSTVTGQDAKGAIEE